MPRRLLVIEVLLLSVCTRAAGCMHHPASQPVSIMPQALATVSLQSHAHHSHRRKREQEERRAAQEAAKQEAAQARAAEQVCAACQGGGW